MKAQKYIPLIILLSLLALELLPYGAVCNFMPDAEQELIRETFSYFSLTPFGYANFGPLLTAILTCVMTVLSFLYLIKPTKKICSLWKVSAVVALITSLAPLMFGLNFYSVTGGAISLLLIAEYLALRRLTST